MAEARGFSHAMTTIDTGSAPRRGALIVAKPIAMQASAFSSLIFILLLLFFCANLA